MNEHARLEAYRELEQITVATDTRDQLAHAARDARKRFSDVFIADMDAHHVENASWNQIVRYIEDPVVREHAFSYHSERDAPTAAPFGLNSTFGMRYQSAGGRIPHQMALREPVDKGVHRDVTLARRTMDGMALDFQILFPTAMLTLGLHPQPHMEAQLSRAYNSWLVQELLPQEQHLGTLVYVPFNTPEEACRTVADFADKPGVLGFCVTSVREKAVHDNAYMKFYRMVEETGKPLAFHAAYHWNDTSLSTMSTFLSVHALGFAWCNIVHATNWVLQGLPEKFPNLKVIWVESGLAWVPWLMQRLDDQYLLRQSEAPLLKKMPSDYLRENCWYSSQPMERSHPKALALTLEMINAESQLLYASDWPHFDFDTPSTIWDIPSLGEQAKRNILGLNASKIFGIDPIKRAGW
jgi:predicted TIM-barrel fold metal-dependent hydrolase